MTNCYEVYEDMDTITVLQNDLEVLKLIRKYLWWGSLHCKIYQNGILILEYKLINNLFRKTRLAILTSHIEPFELTRRYGSYSMEYKGHVFSLRIRSIRSISLYQDNFEAGYLESRPLLQFGLPFKAKLCMHGISEYELYLIIFYLLQKAPPFDLT